jgi:hypothetical protein
VIKFHGISMPEGAALSWPLSDIVIRRKNDFAFRCRVRGCSLLDQRPVSVLPGRWRIKPEGPEPTHSCRSVSVGTVGRHCFYTGLVPSEHSSGSKVKRRGITKAGNTELRRVLIQAAWCYRFPARITKKKEPKLTATDKAIRDIAWKAQVRLCGRYRQLIARGKLAPVACAAVARELATFIWEMGQIVPLIS